MSHAKLVLSHGQKSCREWYANVHGNSVLFVVIAYFVDMWCCYYVFVHQLLDNYHDLITTRVVTGLYRCHELEVYAVAKRSQLIHMLVFVYIVTIECTFVCFYSWCWRGACWCQQNHFVLYSFLILSFILESCGLYFPGVNVIVNKLFSWNLCFYEPMLFIR